MKRPSVVIGQEYLTLVCPNCRNIIPIAQAGEIVTAGRGKLHVGCPFCGQAFEANPMQARVRRLKAIPPTEH